MRPLKQREIFGYSIGDLGINLNFQMIGFYLAYFYTDVFGIPAVHVAGLFLAARVWDAINDPLMGYLADRTESRWGKFRPYLLFGALPLNLVLLACFFTPEMSVTAKIVYAYVTYIAHGMLFTAIGLPYSSISAVMTQDQQERAVISSYRMFFAVVVALTVIILVRPFAAMFETPQEGYTIAVLVMAGVSTTLLLIAFTQSKERVKIEREKYKISQIFPIIFQNKQLLVLALAMFLNTGVWVTMNAAGMYYFKYVFGDESVFSVFFFWMLPANLLGVFTAPIMTKRWGKLAVFKMGSIIVAVFFTARHFIPFSPFAVFLGISLIGQWGQMLCSVTQWGMLPDTVEYGHWKTGFRSEGLPFAFFSFMQKMGLAIAGSTAAFVLDHVGYVANQEQSPEALSAIAWLFNLFPAFYSLLCLGVLMFYKLDNKLFEKVKAELEEKAAAAS